jgi:hypothetical protein
MTRGLALLENNGKSINENADGSFAVPSQRAIRLMKSGYLVTDSFAPVLILNIVRLMPVNTFTPLNYGLESGHNYRMNQNRKSLLRTQFHALNAVLSGSSNTVLIAVSRAITARIASTNSDSHL